MPDVEPAPDAPAAPAHGAGGTRRPRRRATRAADGPLDRALDDTDLGWGERADDTGDRDRWLLEQRPPHYE